MATSSMPLSFLSPRPQHPTISAAAFPAIPKLLFHSRKSLSSISCSFSPSPSQTSIYQKGVSALTTTAPNDNWRIHVSFFPSFLKKTEDVNSVKQELLQAIAPLDRGAEATPDDQKTVDQEEASYKRENRTKNGVLKLILAYRLEAVNPTKEPLKSNLLNGKWELIYTTSQSILQVKRPKFLRSKTNYQAINVDTLRAQNMESWPFFNQVTADLTPLNTKKVAVKFDYFKIAGLIPIKAPGRAKGELEITYLDDELRISRGDLGNLFILKMIDPSHRVPV